MSTATKPVTKARLSELLLGPHRELLGTLPEAPTDLLDQFIFEVISKFAVYNRGSGFELIQGESKLNAMCGLSLEELREKAQYSPDWIAYRANHFAQIEDPG